MRARYTYIKNGKKTDRSFTQTKIERLEEIGLQSQVPKCDEAFEKRCRELIAFKEKFGNCYVPQNYPPNSSLGTWCSNMRTSYRIQKGMTSNCFLSKVKIERLEEFAFQWELPVTLQGRNVVEVSLKGHKSVEQHRQSVPWAYFVFVSNIINMFWTFSTRRPQSWSRQFVELSNLMQRYTSSYRNKQQEQYLLESVVHVIWLVP